MRIESSTSAWECRWTPGDSTERRAVPPEITTPEQIMESSAWPRRSDSSKTNFAGGSGSGCVRIGHSRL